MKTRVETPVDVLLVDDLQENLVALEALIRRPDRRIFCARSGEEALSLMLEHSFALALLDVQMPGMNGFELAELMRGTERTRGIPTPGAGARRPGGRAGGAGGARPRPPHRTAGPGADLAAVRAGGHRARRAGAGAGPVPAGRSSAPTAGGWKYEAPSAKAPNSSPG
jgi:hypothetical protein